MNDDNVVGYDDHEDDNIDDDSNEDNDDDDDDVSDELPDAHGQAPHSGIRLSSERNPRCSDNFPWVAKK